MMQGLSYLSPSRFAISTRAPSTLAHSHFWTCSKYLAGESYNLIRFLSSGGDRHHMKGFERPGGLPKLLAPPEEQQKSTLHKIQKEELETYLYPLLFHGWKLNSGMDKSLHLTRNLVFKGPVSARKYLRKILDAEEKLWHHTTSLHLNSEKRPTLTVVTQTHDLSHPWLSLRDISLAVELEDIYRGDSFSPKSKSAIEPVSQIDAASWTALVLEYPWDADGASIKDNSYECT